MYSAKQFRARDISKGEDKVKRQPYCVVKFGAQSGKTKPTNKKTCNPRWDEIEEFAFDLDGGEYVEVSVWDSRYGEAFEDKAFVGVIRVYLNKIQDKGIRKKWYKLHRGRYANAKVSGRIRLLIGIGTKENWNKEVNKQIVKKHKGKYSKDKKDKTTTDKKKEKDVKEKKKDTTSKKDKPKDSGSSSLQRSSSSSNISKDSSQRGRSQSIADTKESKKRRSSVSKKQKRSSRDNIRSNSVDPKSRQTSVKNDSVMEEPSFEDSHSMSEFTDDSSIGSDSSSDDSEIEKAVKKSLNIKDDDIEKSVEAEEKSVEKRKKTKRTDSSSNISESSTRNKPRPPLQKALSKINERPPKPIEPTVPNTTSTTSEKPPIKVERTLKRSSFDNESEDVSLLSDSEESKKDNSKAISAERNKAIKQQHLFTPEVEVDSELKHDLLLKIILVGESGVGKSNIFSRFTRNIFDDMIQATVGIEFAFKSYKVEGKIVKAQIWDTAGQERYRAVTRQYYRGAHGAILVYDITRKQSFESLETWIGDVKNYSANPNLSVMLVGNKSDLDYARLVNTREGVNFANKHKISFLETSARDTSNINSAFYLLLEEVYEMLKNGDYKIPVVALVDDSSLKTSLDTKESEVVVLKEPEPPISREDSNENLLESLITTLNLPLRKIVLVKKKGVTSHLKSSLRVIHDFMATW